jgi:hypothetical protein
MLEIKYWISEQYNLKMEDVNDLLGLPNLKIIQRLCENLNFKIMDDDAQDSCMQWMMCNQVELSK